MRTRALWTINVTSGKSPAFRTCRPPGSCCSLLLPPDPPTCGCFLRPSPPLTLSGMTTIFGPRLPPCSMSPMGYPLTPAAWPPFPSDWAVWGFTPPSGLPPRPIGRPGLTPCPYWRPASHSLRSGVSRPLAMVKLPKAAPSSSGKAGSPGPPGTPLPTFLAHPPP